MGSLDIADQLIIPDPSIVINQSELQSLGNGLCGIQLVAVGTIDPAAVAIPGVELIHSGDVNLTLDVTSVNPNPQTFTATVTQCGEDFTTSVTISEADLDVPDPTVSIEPRFDAVTCDLLLTVEDSVAIGPSTIIWSTGDETDQIRVSTARDQTKT